MWCENTRVCTQVVTGVLYKGADGEERTATAPLTLVADGMYSNMRKHLAAPQVRKRITSGLPVVSVVFHTAPALPLFPSQHTPYHHTTAQSLPSMQVFPHIHARVLDTDGHRSTTPPFLWASCCVTAPCPSQIMGMWCSPSHRPSCSTQSAQLKSGNVRARVCSQGWVLSSFSTHGGGLC
jgi:2-polyprenyl-6-methoxyphenol hydroxylase-like FAD-dependent oxidoreductase